MNQHRYAEILGKVDAYNRTPGSISPFIAREQGRLAEVAGKIGVPVSELSEFLAELDRHLPQDHLVG